MANPLYSLTQFPNRIIVLNAGRIEEFDTVNNLLLNEDSVFYSMVKEANLLSQLEKDRTPNTNTNTSATNANDSNSIMPIIENDDVIASNSYLENRDDMGVGRRNESN